MCKSVYVYVCGGGTFHTLPAYAREHSFIPRPVFIEINLPQELSPPNVLKIINSYLENIF